MRKSESGNVHWQNTILLLGLLILGTWLGQKYSYQWISLGTYTALNISEFTVLVIFYFFLVTYSKNDPERSFFSGAANFVLCYSLFSIPVTIMDLPRSVPSISWTRTIGIFLGTLFLLMPLFPRKFRLNTTNDRVPVGIGLLMVAINIGLYFSKAPGVLPSIEMGDYRLLFRLATTINGTVIMIVSGIYFLKLYKKDTDQSLIRILCLYFFTFGISRIGTGISDEWELIWWSAQAIRVLGTAIAVYLTIQMYIRTSTIIIDLNQRLKKKNQSLEEKNQLILKQQKELEEQRLKTFHAAQMVAVGQLAGHVAHEINNPLAALSLNTQAALYNLSEKIPLPEAYKEKFQNIERLTDRIALAVKAFRDISRENDQEPLQPTSLKQIVENTLAVCFQKFINSNIRLEVDQIPDVTLLCKKTQISRALLNLLLNAFDAVVPLTNRWVQMKIEQRDGKLQIKIIDSGSGIPPSIEKHIMEPFYTTKEVNAGFGIGLSAAKGFIEEHGGKLYYEPNSPHTCFVIELPVKRT